MKTTMSINDDEDNNDEDNINLDDVHNDDVHGDGDDNDQDDDDHYDDNDKDNNRTHLFLADSNFLSFFLTLLNAVEPALGVTEAEDSMFHPPNDVAENSLPPTLFVAASLYMKAMKCYER